MSTWQRWSHYLAHNKLFNLDTVAAPSLGADGILIRCYAPIHAVPDHHLPTLLQHFPWEAGPSQAFLCTVGEGLLTSDVAFDGMMTNSLQPQLPPPPPPPFSWSPPPASEAPYLILLSCCPHQAWDIRPSLMLSFPLWEPTLQPITPLDNAHHKSSIGLSDTWGLSNTGNIPPPILSSFYSLLPCFVHSFYLFKSSSKGCTVCYSAVLLLNIQSEYWIFFGGGGVQFLFGLSFNLVTVLLFTFAACSNFSSGLSLVFVFLAAYLMGRRGIFYCCLQRQGEGFWTSPRSRGPVTM